MSVFNNLSNHVGYIRANCVRNHVNFYISRSGSVFVTLSLFLCVNGIPTGSLGSLNVHVIMSHMIAADKMATDSESETTESTANLYSSTSHYQPWSKKEYTLYTRRWFMVFVVCVINISNGMVRRRQEKSENTEQLPLEV